MVFSRRMSGLASASEDRCLVEAFHGSDYFRAVPITCDRYEGASILSTDSFLVSAGEVLEQTAEKLWWHARTSMVRTSGTSPVCLVHLDNLIQPNKPDRPNRPHDQDRLADCFRILLRPRSREPS
jgi:hypothetical protein